VDISFFLVLLFISSTETVVFSWSLSSFVSLHSKLVSLIFAANSNDVYVCVFNHGQWQLLYGDVLYHCFFSYWLCSMCQAANYYFLFITIDIRLKPDVGHNLPLVLSY
jgi:hypothetical protein